MAALAYRDHMKANSAGECDFCRTNQPHDGMMRIIANDFPYAVWESREVVDHLMLVPKRHVLTFSEFTLEEKIEYFTRIEEYEALGYSCYTRAQTNPTRSVAHLHTHLLKSATPLSREFMSNLPLNLGVAL